MIIQCNNNIYIALYINNTIQQQSDLMQYNNEKTEQFPRNVIYKQNITYDDRIITTKYKMIIKTNKQTNVTVYNNKE